MVKFQQERIFFYSFRLISTRIIIAGDQATAAKVNESREVILPMIKIFELIEVQLKHSRACGSRLERFDVGLVL